MIGEDMSYQQVFDHVVMHLAKQGKRSMREEGGGCAYRGKDNTSCAVGCLINDTDYKYQFEGYPIKQLVALHPYVVQSDMRLVLLLMDLQHAHDNSISLELLKSNLISTSNKFDLNADLVDEIKEWVYDVR